MSPPRPEGVQHAPGEEWRTITISSKKNELAGPKRKWHPVVDISGDRSKIQCCKEQYCKLRGMMRDREAWCAAVRGVAKSWTRLGDWTTTMKLKLRPLTYTEPFQGPVLEFDFVILYLFFQRGSPLPSVLASGLSLEEDKEGDWREERKEEVRRGEGWGGEGKRGENKSLPKDAGSPVPALELLSSSWAPVPDGMFIVNWRMGQFLDLTWLTVGDLAQLQAWRTWNRSHVTGRSSQEGWAAIFLPQTILPALVCRVHQHGAHRMQSVGRSSSDQRLSAPGLCPGEWFGTPSHPGATFLLQLQMSFFYSKCIPLKKEQTNQNKRVIVTTATEIYTLNTFPCDEIFFYNI